MTSIRNGKAIDTNGLPDPHQSVFPKKTCPLAHRPCHKNKEKLASVTGRLNKVVQPLQFFAPIRHPLDIIAALFVTSLIGVWL